MQRSSVFRLLELPDSRPADGGTEDLRSAVHEREACARPEPESRQDDVCLFPRERLRPLRLESARDILEDDQV